MSGLEKVSKRCKNSPIVPVIADGNKTRADHSKRRITETDDDKTNIKNVKIKKHKLKFNDAFIDKSKHANIGKDLRTGINTNVADIKADIKSDTKVDVDENQSSSVGNDYATNSGYVVRSQFSDGGLGDVGMQWRNVRLKNSKFKIIHNSFNINIPEDMDISVVEPSVTKFVCKRCNKKKKLLAPKANNGDSATETK